MKRIILGLTGLAGLAAVFMGTGAFSTPQADPGLGNLTGDVARGAYLARASGCIACHTDVDGGGQPLAGGAPLETPFGTFHAPNLTTDPEHGIGAWTLQDFARALRHGIAPDGSPYYPAFPYTFYTGFSDQDIADLWAAFRTVPAVPQPSKEQALAFPYSIREGLRLWQTLYFEPKRFEPNPDGGDLHNRGAYLVEAAGHCAACHTPATCSARWTKRRHWPGPTAFQAVARRPRSMPGR
ncbi:c-type cytochrome [Marinobacterium aestuariivivens]|uniref:C-type cytochrome n=1 Tax=Marinobacterium aestuariivivens TaxID=1698799 RepID=A0ABW2A7X5_9GAMM